MSGAERAIVERALDDLLDGFQPGTTEPAELFGRQFDLGLAWVHFDPDHGGLGLPAALQKVVDARLALARAPSAFHRNPLGIGMVAPTIHAHGDERQRSQRLRPLFTGEEIWCQLFSEPGAGSDLASVSTGAVREGDAWTVNGQKVWTSYAHKARWGLLLARTDPSVKHAGLTAFMLDMAAPGVEVRPLFQMTGDAEFNEVYLTDVRVPDADRLGPVGEGWTVTRTTLLNERVAIGDQVGERGDGIIGTALDLWRTTAPDRRTPVRRDRLARLWVRAETLRLLNLRLRAERGDGAPGPEGSMGKVLSARLNQDVAAFEMDLLGAAATLKAGGYPLERSTRDPFAYGDVVHDFLRAQANSIEGGTSDVSRNILAERLLGLPKEPRP